MTNVGKPSVLLVDDNEATCTLIAAILRKNFTVESVSNGMQAVEKLRINQYATVLLDLRMPRYDGFTVLEFLKETNAAMLRKVLVVTASLARKEMERARSYGVCGIVTKPFDIDALLNAVRDCAATADGGSLPNVFCSTTPMILLIADLLTHRLM